MESNSSIKERQYYFDYLRIFASIGVVMIHTASSDWYKLSINSFDWISTNFYHALGRWAVPIFFMISGALFLSKDITISKLWNKYIKHLFIIFFSWSFGYALATFIIDRDIHASLASFITGHFHEWYILAAIGLYIVTPVLKKIIEDKKICEYFLLISFIFSFALPSISTFCTAINHFAYITSFINNLGITKIPCYLGYYVLGYYLNSYEIKNKKLIYILGILGIFLRLGESYAITFYSGTAFQGSYGNAMPNVLFSSMALFIFAKSKFNEPKNKKLITNLSKYTLCIYLVHPLVLAVLHKVGITSSMFSPIFAIPCVFLLAYLVSLLISFVLNKIPFIKDNFV